MPDTPAARRGMLLALGVLTTLLLAGCDATGGVATLTGDDDDTTPTPTATTGSEDPEEALLAFTECMRENGIDMPDPVIRDLDGSGGNAGAVDEAEPGEPLEFDPNSDAFRAAQEACDEHLEGLGALEPGQAPELTAEEEEAFLNFAECMRENGIDMPDPGSGGMIMRPGSENDIDPSSDEFRAAEEECRSHLEDVLGPVEEVGP